MVGFFSFSKSGQIEQFLPYKETIDRTIIGLNEISVNLSSQFSAISQGVENLGTAFTNAHAELKKFIPMVDNALLLAERHQHDLGYYLTQYQVPQNNRVDKVSRTELRASMHNIANTTVLEFKSLDDFYQNHVHPLLRQIGYA
jgi:hypothetical protein